MAQNNELENAASSKRAVEHKGSERRAAFVVIADVGPMEIELSPGDVAASHCERKRRIDFPLHANSRAHFFVAQPGAVEGSVAMAVAERIIHPKGVGLDIRASKEREVPVDQVLEAWRWENGVEYPLRRKFPANTTAGQDREPGLDVDADADDELHLRAMNVGAAEDKRD